MNTKFTLASRFLAFLLLVACAGAQVNLNDLSGGCDPTISSDAQCGGYGACDVVNLTCTCVDLWAQEADFIDGSDCPTSIIAMYVLWSVNVIEIIWVLYSTSYVLVARAENFFEQRKIKKDYTLWKNKGLIALIVYFGLGLPTHLMMAILNLVNPLTRVGFDIFPTLLFFLSKCGLYITSIFLQGPLIATVLKGQAEFNQIVKLNYILNFCISSASIIAGSFAFITHDYYQTDLPKQLVIMRAYYLVQALTLIVNGTQAYLVKRRVFSSLDSAKALVSSQDKTESIKRKIGNLQNQIIKQGILQGVVYLVMGLTPFFINKHKYFLPMSWLAMPILGKRLAFQFDLDKAGAKSIATRLGLQKSSTVDNNSAVTGSKKKGREGDVSANRDMTHSENPSFMYVNTTAVGSVVEGDDNPKKKNGKKGKKNAKDNVQILSVALSDEEGGMNEIMADVNGPLRDKFTEFVRSKYASETLDLYDACVKYQAAAQIADAGKRAPELSKIGQGIVDSHVKEGAAQPVDMPDSMRKSLLEVASADKFDTTTLDPVKTMAFDLLKSNFYQHFAKSLLA